MRIERESNWGKPTDESESRKRRNHTFEYLKKNAREHYPDWDKDYKFQNELEYFLSVIAEQRCIIREFGTSHLYENVGKYLEHPAWHSPKITDFLLVDLIDAERLLLERRFHFELFPPEVADQIHRLDGFHYDQKTKQRHISNPIPFSPKFKETKKRYIRRGAIVLGISFVLIMVLHNNLTGQHDMAFQFNSGWLFSDEVEGPSLRELIYVLAGMGVFGTCALVIWSFLKLYLPLKKRAAYRKLEKNAQKLADARFEIADGLYHAETLIKRLKKLEEQDLKIHSLTYALLELRDE